MLSRLGAWLVMSRSQPLTTNESRAVFAMLLMIAFCFNALPPNFFFDGNTPSGESGNLLNQVFWVFVFALALSSWLRGARSFQGVLAYTVPLCLLCLLMLLSAVWSLEPSITLRRAVLQCLVVACVFLSILSLPKPEQVFILTYRVASIVLVFNLLMLTRANGFDEAGLFRGVHPHKNVVGYISATSIIVGVWARLSGNLSSRYWNNFYVLAWFVLLLLSVSKTSIALTLGAPVLALTLWFLSKWLRVPLWVPIFVMLSAVYAIYAVTYILGVDLVAIFVDWVQRIGFTGRDDIWGFLIARFLERPWLGHGFGGFWDIGPTSPNVVYGTGFIPMLNQAHNGYVDIFLNLGVLGAFAYLLVLITFFVALSSSKAENKHIYLLCWCLLVFSLLHNLTETSILRGYAWVWVVQLIVFAVTYRLAIEKRKTA